MNGFQKMGGFAALIEAATYLVGFGLLFTMLAPLAGDLDPNQYVAFMADNRTTMYLWNLIIYVVNGAFLVVLVLALHDQLKSGASALMQTATAFGLIWAGLVIASGMLILNNMGVVLSLYDNDPSQATLVWQTLNAVEDGLGGGVELPGGIWVLLVSWVALQTGRLSKPLNWLGIVVGAAGILTLVPTLDVMESVFGLGLLVWFVWAGIVLLGSKVNTPMPAPQEVAASR